MALEKKLNPECVVDPLFGQILVQGSVLRTGDNTYNTYNILDNFENLLLCFHIFGVRRRKMTIHNPRALWLTEDVWYQNYVNKKEGF